MELWLSLIHILEEEALRRAEEERELARREEEERRARKQAEIDRERAIRRSVRTIRPEEEEEDDSDGLELESLLSLIHIFHVYLTNPHSRGVSGALYLQAARAGVMFCPGCFTVKLPLVRGVDVLVLRNGNL